MTRLLPAPIALVVLAAGCGGATHHVAAVHAPAVHRCAAGAERPLGTATSSWAAVVVRPAAAYREPGRRPFARFGRLNANGVPTVLSVLAARLDGGCRLAWLHVRLPLRPNGTTGWVRAADVRTLRVRTRIVVDLSERRVRLYRDGRLVLAARAAIGAPSTPTPLGRYYVNQRLLARDPGGPFGPGAVGISAFSPVLTDWVQEGPVAIHGTNEPSSIGRAVSSGCLRVRNAVLRRLYAQTPEGTPVLIRR